MQSKPRGGDNSASQMDITDPSSSIKPPTTAPTSVPSVPQTATNDPSSSVQPRTTISTSVPLPDFSTVLHQPFTWGHRSGTDFAKALDKVYGEVVHWKRNCFTVPNGRAGRDFVSELARLYQAYGSSSAMEPVSLKAVMVFPILMLQKPWKRLKSTHHIQCLGRRIKSWLEGNLEELLEEGRALQQRLPKQWNEKANSTLARTFANLMFAGKCKAALDLLSNSHKGGLLHLQDHVDTDDPSSPTVRELLDTKHPPAQPCHQECLMQEDPTEPHPVIFEALDASVIRFASLRVSGAAGPSGLDSHQWRRLCTSYKGASRDLCASLALVARKICTSFVDPTHLAPMLACRLVALDKCPGVRPIGIGDTARRIISKAVLSIVGPDIQDATGCLQMCGGQISGVEAAFHATKSAFDSEENEAALLVDATNAFNSLNRQVALQNIRRLCPSIATILVNTYRNPIDLYVDGDILLSQEGTTQGDPLAMPMYALATIPLIKKLTDCKQVWYADDSAAIGEIVQLRCWWDKLSVCGPGFGYFPNPSKTWLVTKPEHLETASTVFSDAGINITTDGRPYLGGAIGSLEYINQFVKAKVEEWSSSIKILAEIARTQPHAAFSALTHGLLSKWTYLCRVQPDISNLLVPLDDLLRTHLFPALTGRPPPNDLECALFDLPARLGGLGIRLPSKHAEREFQSSQLVTRPLKEAILNQEVSYSYEIVVEQSENRKCVSNQNRSRSKEAADTLYQQLPPTLQKAMELAREKGASSWLTVLPLNEHKFSLHRAAFLDAISLRYGWAPANLATTCVCGKAFTVDHALSCGRGGFPMIRHNEIRNLTAQLLTEVCSEVCLEPELQPVSPDQLQGATANRQDGARLDVAANGVWGGSFEKTYFDVRVVNPYAASNRRQSQAAMYRSHEREKKRAYEQRIREVEHSSFTPLVFSATGGMGSQATTFYKRLASMLAVEWDMPYSTTLRWLRCRLCFSLLRSAIQAIRGARSSCGHAGRAPGAIDLIISESRLSEG